jgi:hypothetical protein
MSSIEDLHDDPQFETQGGPLVDHAKMTVAEYLLGQLYTLGVSHLHTVSSTLSSPLVIAAIENSSLINIVAWDTPEEALWASQTIAQSQGLSALYLPEHFLSHVFNSVTATSTTVTPLLHIVQRSLISDIKEICGMPMSAKERGRSELRHLIQKLSASYLLLEDRRTAASRIDRSLDTSLELLQPSVIDLPDEVAQAYIPPHTYRKTVFNYEEGDLIKNIWDTIILRLEQAKNPLFVLGEQCWPDMWHHVLLVLAGQFEVNVIASEALWGHLGSYTPPEMHGYQVLHSPDLLETYDSTFVFGVAADHPWLESLLTNHDLVGNGEKELFVLHTTGVSFGDGSDAIPPPPLGEFFFRAPLIERKWIEQQDSFKTQAPDWYQLVLQFPDKKLPLFATHDLALLSCLMSFPPFAMLYIQPEEADERWLSVASESVLLKIHAVSLVAGSNVTLSKAFEKAEPLILENIIFLLYDTKEQKDEFVSEIGAIQLTSEEMVTSWFSERDHPGLIWIDSN